jgi:hydrogenase nickel incorporation protein HypB
MCTDCGCSKGAKATITDMGTGEVSMVWREAVHEHTHTHATSVHHSHPHDHDGEPVHSGHDHNAHDHAHDHFHVHADGTRHAHPHSHDHAHAGVPHGHTDDTVQLEHALLAKNEALAALNRAWLAGRQVLMVNLVSSPGSGKTTLLERTIRELGAEVPISVIEGDQATHNDGERIRAAGAAAVQVNTGTGCHLEADMIERALKQLKPKSGSIVMVENVGNLVCPALFDLGEAAKVAILSVTEGEDKPLKYPHMFQASKLVLLNKTDLLPHLDFDVQKAVDAARTVNPGIEVIEVSARSGAGMQAWYGWLRKTLAQSADDDH